MSHIQNRLAALSSEKRLQLLERLQAKRSGSEENPTIGRRPDQGTAPLSFAQQRLWFLNQMNPHSPAYNLAEALRLSGRLDMDIMRRVMQEIIRRHEVLRTVFREVDGEAVQVILPEVAVPLAFVDLRDLPAGEREAAVQRHMWEEVHRPFDLINGPVVRTLFWQIGDNEYVMLLTMHHIATDGWSMGVLVNEVGALYQARVTGRPSPFPELPVQYADFAYWQRNWLQGEVLGQQLDFMRNQLVGCPDLLALPTDRPRPGVQTYNGATHPVTIPQKLTERLEELGRQEGATLFMTLLAAFSVLLARYSGQEDFCVGTPFANRNRLETEALIGFFVNTLVVRADLSGSPNFIDMLRRVRGTLRDVYANQDVPFEKLVDALRPERSMSYNPLFQVMFVLQQKNSPPELHDLRLDPLPIPITTAKFDLTLCLTRVDGELTGYLEYNTDLFDPPTIARMAAHFATLLAALAESPEVPVDALPILSEVERQQLAEWNATAVPHPVRCIHELVEEKAAQIPGAVAVVYEGSTLSYADLNARANQLAHYLRKRGVGPEVLVGICAERSLEMVIGLLGILKAGGAYVPFDPTYPAERLAYMLADAAAPVLLTYAHLVERLPEHGAVTIRLDADWDKIAAEPTANLVSGVRPDNLAYMIYTSGSTGRPKGALNEHRGICNRLLWMQQQYGLDESDRVLQKTPFSFDVSAWEFFWPLLTGARLVLAKPGGHQDSRYLVELIQREEITTLHFVPSMLQVFIEEEGVERCKSIRRVICSGEALPYDLQERFFGRLDTELHNLYGPTEAAVDVTYWACRKGDSRRSVPIGRPVANTQVHILDARLQPLPVGVAGELHIGGVQVGRGYWNRPDLTAEKFIPDPFRRDPGAKLYKTGDLARYLPDGAIEYLGRLDHQVKIRGFRIELGEIEAALAKHPGVAQAVVLPCSDTGGSKYLAAYVVPNVRGAETEPEGALNATDLRAFLKESLPEYMVPNAVVLLEVLPLSPNGKVDRKALPDPMLVRQETLEYTAPQTPAEEALATVWGEVLGVERVGVTANFFELGGDSIRSIQVRARARKQGYHFDLVELFQNPTVRQLAGVARRDETVSSAARTSPFSLITPGDRAKIPDGVTDAYPLNTPQAGMLFHSEVDTESAVYHDIFSYFLKAPFDAQALEESVRRLVARHPALRTGIEMRGYSEPLQLVWQTVESPLAVEDLRHLSAAEQDKVLSAWREAEKRRPFDYRKPPLLRLQVHRTRDDRFWLTASFHHAILDGWSVASMLTELGQEYAALRNGKELKLGPTPRSPGEVVALEREVLASAAAQSHFARVLSDFSVTKLPRLASGENPSGVATSARFDRTLAPELVVGLDRLAKAAQVPLKSVLLAAHMRVLGLLGGTADVMTGVVVNGRPEESDAERLLGFFLNVPPLRLTMNGGTWLDLVRETFAAERELLAFRRYPLARLQQRYGGRAALFDVIFNYIHFHVYQGLAEAADLEVLGADTYEQTNFPLMVNFQLDPLDAGLLIGLIYDPAYLSQEQMEAVAGYYTRVLEQMVSEPDAHYEAASLLTEQEVQQLLVGWNDTATDYPRDRCVHELFEEQVERTPDAVAVVFEGQELSYGELNRRANQLAHYLKRFGVGPDLLVGVCVERSLEMVVGLLGILKAGGAYVPLDPTYPQDRLAYMLADAHVKVLLTQERLEAGLPEHGAHAIRLDADWDKIAGECTDNLTSGVQAEHLAYVIFTSGSTGKPKGVQVKHGGLANFLMAMRERLGVTDRDPLLAVTSISFDIAGLELYLPLIVGSRVALVSKAVAADGQQLAAALRDSGAKVLQATPATWQMLLNAGWHNHGIRVLVGGEALPRNLADRLLEGANSVWNLYGPTETTIWSTVFQVTNTEGAISIGRPIANTSIYLLDRHLKLVPVGVAGELYIGGAGVARGYLNRPELTAERFIENPFGGGRLYRTGDLARYLPDGNIEYLGRLDHQVKIRGFRIELGEIEAVLADHPEIREVIVLAREDMPGEKRLVAYIVPAGGRALSTAELRAFVAGRLPEYMIPSVFVTLEALPLTPNGKVDRRALPMPEQTHTELAAAYVAPRTAEENVLAGIWADVLGVKQVGIHDSFFMLGGHSLLAGPLMAQVNRTFQIELPIRVLFEATTVAQMAEVLIKYQAKPEQAAAVATLVERVKDLSPAELAKLLEQKRQQKAARSTAGSEVDGK